MFDLRDTRKQIRVVRGLATLVGAMILLFGPIPRVDLTRRNAPSVAG